MTSAIVDIGVVCNPRADRQIPPEDGRRAVPSRKFSETVDNGPINGLLGPERAIGCVVYPAAEMPEPGVIQHTDGNRFTLGEPDGSSSERVKALARALIDAGLKAPVKPLIRVCGK